MRKTSLSPLKAGLALALALGLSSAACESKNDKQATPAPETPPTAPSTAAPVVAAPVVAVASDAAPSAAAPVSATGPTTVAAVSTGGTVTVDIKNYSYYCSPKPVFEDSVEGDILILQLKKPSGPITRCVSAVDMTLSFKGIDAKATVNKVEVREVDGKLKLAGSVTRTR